MENPRTPSARSIQAGISVLLPATFIALSALLFVGPALAGIAAFPGAEGYGANALGGRGGEVYIVRNLCDYKASEISGDVWTAGSPPSHCLDPGALVGETLRFAIEQT